MTWSQDLQNKSTNNPAMQAPVDAPVTAAQMKYNEGLMYAKAGACFGETYAQMIQAQQGRSA